MTEDKTTVPCWLVMLIVMGCPALLFGCFFGGLLFNVTDSPIHGWVAVIVFAIGGAITGLAGVIAFTGSLSTQHETNKGKT